MPDPFALMQQAGAYTYKGRTQLPAYTSLGCYTMIYLTVNNDVLCADCASTDYFDWLYALTVNRRDLPFAIGYDDPPILADAFYEGPDEHCEGCGVAIPSSYGDPDA